jgi:uncharacterized protein
MSPMREIADRATQVREVRKRDVTDLSVATEADVLRFEGIASVVDTPYLVRDMFGEYAETMSKGVFNRTLKQKADVRMLVNHDGVPVARTKSGTLTLSADPHLRAGAELDIRNPTVQEVGSALERGDLDQMSIGFRVRDQRWNADYTEREIREVELFDVSVVTYPASPTTSASLRSIDELLAADMSDWTEDEVRRAIAYMTTLLPAVEAEQRQTEEPVTLEPSPLLLLWEQRRQPVA